MKPTRASTRHEFQEEIPEQVKCPKCGYMFDPMLEVYRQTLIDAGLGESLAKLEKAFDEYEERKKNAQKR